MEQLIVGTPCFEAFCKHYDITDKEWYCVDSDRVEFIHEYLDEWTESFLLGWNSSEEFYNSLGGIL